MVDTRRKRYEKSLEVFGKKSDWPAGQFMIAICLTQLDRYVEAQRFYALAIRGFLKDRRQWYGTNQPDWLVDAYNLANHLELCSQVEAEIEAFKHKNPQTREAPVTLYADAVICLTSRRDEEASQCVPMLVKKPQIKWAFAVGETIRAIIQFDQAAFDSALGYLLEVHRGAAKFGGLRETPEGYLCLPAMSLSKIALECGLKVNVASEYLSKGYLDHLLRAGSSSS